MFLLDILSPYLSICKIPLASYFISFTYILKYMSVLKYIYYISYIAWFNWRKRQHCSCWWVGPHL